MAFFEDARFNKVFEPEDLLNSLNRTTEASQIDNLWGGNSITSAIRIICVLLLRAGFILVQVGSIPVENAFMIIFRNIIEIAVAIFSYGFIGFLLSFGQKSFYGIANYNGYIGNKEADLSLAALGFCSCLLGSAITSSLLVARLHQVPMIFLTFLSSASFFPMLMCWCWSNSGWMTQVSMMEQRVSVKDFGGNIVVHVPAATIGLLGAVFLGRRIMRLSDIDKFSIGNEYSTGIVTGYVFVIIGHIGFNMPTTAYEARHMLKDYISLVSVNSLMALAAGILAVSTVLILLTRDIYRYWIIVKCLQGGLAGLITVAAGIDIYTPLINFGIACIGGLVFFVSSNLLQYSALEDCCSIVAIYLVCGSIGLLLPPLLGNDENLGFTVGFRLKIVHVLWQFVCLMVVVLVTIVVFLLVFTAINCLGILKNQFEIANHQRAKILHGRLPWKRYFDRVFMINNKNNEISPESNRDAMNQTIINPA